MILMWGTNYIMVGSSYGLDYVLEQIIYGPRPLKIVRFPFCINVKTLLNCKFIVRFRSKHYISVGSLTAWGVTFLIIMLY